jgi:hypothetical protein
MKSQKELSSVITRSAVLLTEFWPILFRPVPKPNSRPQRSGNVHIPHQERTQFHLGISKQYSPMGIHVMLAFLVLLTCAVPQSRADNLPAGSYLQSCQRASVQNNELFARCQSSVGTWMDSSLSEISGCVGDIFNVEGHLHCNRNMPLPDFSYRRTCRDIYVEAGFLFASCKMSNNITWVPWFVPDFKSCHGDIFNFEGFVSCNKGQLPAGSYLKSCSDLFASGSILGGHCTTNSGGSKTTSLQHPETCRGGSIENRDGSLICGRI